MPRTPAKRLSSLFNLDRGNGTAKWDPSELDMSSVRIDKKTLNDITSTDLNLCRMENRSFDIILLFLFINRLLLLALKS